MKLFGFEHHRNGTPWNDAPAWAVELREMLGIIIKTLEIEMATIDELVTDVADEDTTIDAAVVAINGLNDQIEALKTTQTDPATAAKIDALVADITAKKTKLAAAFVVGTPTPAPSAAPVTPAAADTLAKAAVAANPA